MSRLIKYINEGLEEVKDIQEYVKILEKDCSNIIGIYKKKKEFFYRGINKRIKNNKDFIEKKMRVERRPRNTDKKTHDRMNKIFKEKFGWNVRDGISTTTRHFQASMYGYVYIFFPVNNYKFCYSSSISDIYTYLRKQPSSVSDEQWEINSTESIKELVKTYTDKNIEGALGKKQGEVMFNTKKYYLLDDIKFYEYLKDMWDM